MRTRLAIISSLISLPCSISATAAELIEVPADSHKGFEFPYVLFIPKAAEGGVAQYLLIEPNNTGIVDDNLEVHRAAAIHTAKESGVGYYVATHLRIPLLVPVFPRPKSMENVYTHSLDRDTILIRDGPLRRIDLQLIAMADDAKRRLAELGRPVNEKLLMNGFSASGLFANRFTFLHPEVVAAAAYGGLNGFIMVPSEEMQSRPLEFPLGLADYKDIAGHSFDRLSYGRIPQFAYMGEKDDNDAVLSDDAYPEPERSLVFELFGRKMMPDRWEAVQAVYREQKLPVEFKTYLGYGHETDGKINGEVADFFRRVIEHRPKT
jgi:dienelactone hydrolase